MRAVDFGLFVLLALVVFRVTRLLTADGFPPVAKVRDRIETRYEDRWPAYLATCPWCVSVYVAAGVVGLAVLAGASLPLPLAWWGALSATTGLIAVNLDAV